jgi:hypothetical protein
MKVLACLGPMNAPLYVCGIAEDGRPMIGGAFKMQDSVGYPIEILKLDADANDCLLDYLEALCECWLNDCLKFDSFCRDIRSLKLEYDVVERFKELGAAVLSHHPEMMSHPNPIDEVCRFILKQKRNAQNEQKLM